MFWAAVPEAAIDKHGDASACKDQVCAEPLVRCYSSVNSVTQAALVKYAPDRHFAVGIPPPLRNHPDVRGFIAGERRIHLWTTPNEMSRPQHDASFPIGFPRPLLPGVSLTGPKLREGTVSPAQKYGEVPRLESSDHGAAGPVARTAYHRRARGFNSLRRRASRQP